MNVKEYLIESIMEDKQNHLTKGWDYLKANITDELKLILQKKEYWDLKYNSQKADFIIKELNLNLGKEQYRQLESFVYIFNTKRREEQEAKELKELETNLFNRGFTKQKIVEVINDRVIDYNEDLKKLNGLKVICVMDISKIGLMGSYDKKEELEGTLTYSDYHKGLMLIPKRSRTRGFIIRKNFYYKIKGVEE